jgi:hypothetical protein
VSDKGVRVEYDVHFKRDRRARKLARQGPPPTTSAEPVPRIARLLALAHKWEGMVRRGEVKDYAEIARLMGLSRARVTQICGMAFLAPDLQEALLAGRMGCASIAGLRPIGAFPSWPQQRAAVARRRHRG